MIVVADTSPINYLILIEEIDILTKLYGRVVIPRAVRDELLRPSAPEMVRAWSGQLPTWLEVHTPVNAPDALLVKLDPGERDAILLAGELRADQLIVDDRQGRHEAEKRGIPVMGTLGVLREAATIGLLDLRIAVKRLQGTSFYLAPEVLTRLLKDQP
jgi:predicted nucleic acid-binding protein